MTGKQPPKTRAGRGAFVIVGRTHLVLPDLNMGTSATGLRGASYLRIGGR